MLNFLIFMNFALIAVGFYFSLDELKYRKNIKKRGSAFYDGSDGGGYSDGGGDYGGSDCGGGGD